MEAKTGGEQRMLEAFLSFIWSAVSGYLVLCLICSVLFAGMLAFEWWANRREKKKQDISMKEVLEELEDK